MEAGGLQCPAEVRAVLERQAEQISRQKDDIGELRKRLEENARWVRQGGAIRMKSGCEGINDWNEREWGFLDAWKNGF